MIGQFGLKSTKTDRDGPVWAQIYQNGPRWASLSSNLPNLTVISQFGPLSTKTASDWSVQTQDGSIMISFGDFWSKLAHHGPFW